MTKQEVFYVNGFDATGYITSGTTDGKLVDRDYIKVDGQLINRAYVFLDTKWNREHFLHIVNETKRLADERAAMFYSTLNLMTRPEIS